MSEPQFGEPWSAEAYGSPPEDTRQSSGFCLIQDKTGRRVTENCTCCDGLNMREDELARIVACVNFCREFPTSALVGRHLWFASQERLDEWKRTHARTHTIADLPNYEAMMICVFDEVPQESAGEGI